MQQTQRAGRLPDVVNTVTVGNRLKLMPTNLVGCLDDGLALESSSCCLCVVVVIYMSVDGLDTCCRGLKPAA